MKLSSIIAEFNPFHNGHQYLLDKVKKELCPDSLLVIMSGSVVQRGEIAMLDKYTRAVHAVMAGADIVIELPTVFSASNAEWFAKGAVSLLSRIRDNEVLCFGSENGSLGPLESTADLLNNEPSEVADSIRSLVDMGISYPVARHSAITSYAADNHIEIADISQPNNILAVEYLRALSACRSTLSAYTIKRQGDYHDLNMSAAAPSASAIRAAFGDNDVTAIEGAVPPFVLDSIANASRTDYLSPIMMHTLKSLSVTQLADIYDVREGLENRIKRLSADCIDYTELLTALATKRYTDSRLRRICISALLGITKALHSEAETMAPYYNVLAIRRSKTSLLSALKSAGTLFTGEAEIAASGNKIAMLNIKSSMLQEVVRGVKNVNNGMVIV